MDSVNQQSMLFKETDQEQQLAWRYLIQQARAKRNASNWEEASIFYTQAFAIAEQLMCKQTRTQGCAVHRYLNTAEEFAYVMKKNEFSCALAQFSAQIKDNLTHQQSRLSQAELTLRLNALAACN